MYTPASIDSQVKMLVSKICPNSTPIYVPVIPEDYAQSLWCFPSVQEKIRRDGGEMVLGWQIWRGNFIIEGEFHAVWKSPKQELIDISQKQFYVDEILFLPDPKTKYIGHQVDNIRIPIIENILVKDFIEVAEAKYRVLNIGKLADQFGEMKFKDKNLDRIKQLLQIGAGVERMLSNNATKNDPCFCGAPARYKHCHGKQLRKLLKRM